MKKYKKPIVILSHACHPAITQGFIPAAKRLGWPVVLLTDHRLEHLAYYVEHGDAAPAQIIECDVFNPLSLLDLLHDADIAPAAVFSNSDHLQTSTSLLAAGLGLPAKRWQVCYAAKNKAAMRERLHDLGLPGPWFHALAPQATRPETMPFPLIAKPREGVASLDVRLCRDAVELDAYLAAFWQRHPHRAVLLEAVLEGPLYTLETLADGESQQALGGFEVRLSTPPHFVELEARWRHADKASPWREMLDQLRRFGIDFGVCHSEFILTAQGPVLVEINARSIGDGREFLLDEMYHGRWFESILRLHLGETLPELPAQHRQALIRYYPLPHPGRLERAAADFESHDGTASVRYHALRQPGDTLRRTDSNKDYLGRISALGDDEAKLEATVQAAEAQLDWQITPAADEVPNA